ncbi:hypothetical protein [Capybara microvirus Cap1_SP_131]|nr:hypothetical protein [Capybara microvirus Cap1_SP_131]
MFDVDDLNIFRPFFHDAILESSGDVYSWSDLSLGAPLLPDTILNAVCFKVSERLVSRFLMLLRSGFNCYFDLSYDFSPARDDFDFFFMVEPLCADDCDIVLSWLIKYCFLKVKE